jgi:hypothetical protein
MIPRRQLLVDPKVQRALMIRVVLYWFLFAVTVAQVIVAWDVATGPDGPFWSHWRFAKVWQEHWIVVVAGLIVAPFVLLDVAYISNRIVGPLNRVRQTLTSLAAGQQVAPLKFREKDYFHDIADQINAVSARMAELEAQLRAAKASGAATDEQPALSH